MELLEIEELRKQLLSRPKDPVQGPRKMKRSDCTLQEWTDHQRALERGYDAKRRAKKREAGPELTMDERRAKREAIQRRANPPPASNALDTVVSALEALTMAASQGQQPATGCLAELEEHIRERLSRLKNTIQQ